MKRKLCCGGSSIKTSKDLEAYVSTLEPDKPIQSVSWQKHDPPSINSYNLILAGKWNSAIVSALPDSIGYVDSTSPNEIYSYFLHRKNQHLLKEAERMIDQMLADVAKDLQPLIVC